MPPVAAPRSDRGAVGRRARRVVERRCIVCREVVARDRLWRVSRSAGGAIRLDPEGRLEGRGAYFCRTEDCATAVAANPQALARALRAGPSPVVLETIARAAGLPIAHSSLSDCKESH